MSKIALSGLGAWVVLSLLASSAIAEPPAPLAATQMVQVAAQASVRGVPASELPNAGECRIWYDALPAASQPAQMDCEHAHWLAQRWGGRVISHDRELAAYDGRNDFTGVPVSELPRRGYCRAWLEGVATHAQPAQSDCRAAQRMANAGNGRVIYMPL